MRARACVNGVASFKVSAPGVPDRPSVTGLCPRVPGTRARAAALIRPSRIPRRRRRRPGKSALSGRPSARFWRRAVDALSGRRGATPLVRRPRPPTRPAKTAAKRRRREMATRHEPGAALISVIKSQKNYGSLAAGSDRGCLAYEVSE